MAVMAGIWVYAVEPTASDILKTAVGPGVGALVGASLAFHAQAVHKAREEYRRQVAALREAQFAVHYRLVILSAFYKTEMVPVEKNCDRWARVRVKPMAISEMVPPVKVDRSTSCSSAESQRYLRKSAQSRFPYILRAPQLQGGRLPRTNIYVIRGKAVMLSAEIRQSWQHFPTQFIGRCREP